MACGCGEGEGILRVPKVILQNGPKPGTGIRRSPVMATRLRWVVKGLTGNRRDEKIA
jgi:hypothetical protein